jgi:hypothetical protein
MTGLLAAIRRAGVADRDIRDGIFLFSSRIPRARRRRQPSGRYHVRNGVSHDPRPRAASDILDAAPPRRKQRVGNLVYDRRSGAPARAREAAVRGTRNRAGRWRAQPGGPRPGPAIRDRGGGDPVRWPPERWRSAGPPMKAGEIAERPGRNSRNRPERRPPVTGAGVRRPTRRNGINPDGEARFADSSGIDGPLLVPRGVRRTAPSRASRSLGASSASAMFPVDDGDRVILPKRRHQPVPLASRAVGPRPSDGGMTLPSPPPEARAT